MRRTIFVCLGLSLASSVAVAGDPVVAAGRSIAIMQLKGLGQSEDTLAYAADLIVEGMVGRGVRVVERTRMEAVSAGMQQWDAFEGILTAQYIVGGTVTGGKKTQLTGNCRSVDSGDFVARFETKIKKWKKAGPTIDGALDGVLPERAGKPAPFPTGKQFLAAYVGKDTAAAHRAFTDLLGARGNTLVRPDSVMVGEAPTHALVVAIYVVDAAPSLSWRVIDTRSYEVLLAGHLFDFPTDPAKLAAAVTKIP